MSEVRVDPLSGTRSVVAAHRGDRPGAFLPVTPPQPVDPATDPFAPGNEHETPPEVHAVREDGSAPDTPGWRVRAVPNRFPVVTAEGEEPEPVARRELFTAQAATGAHEVVVNAPEGVQSLGDLPVEQVELAMGVWRARMRAHAERAACLHLFVNERPEGGASLPHTHAQLVALDFVPAQVARERERFAAHAVRTMGGDLLQDLVQEEVKQRKRLVAYDDDCVLLAAYAPRTAFQLLLAPRAGRERWEDEAGPSGAALLHDALQRLRRVLGAMPPLNLWIRTAPRGAERFCWRIDVLPRLAHQAGLELGTGLGVTPVAPEDVAAQLRAAAG
ncbi:DUF4921 family protein [Conexibacter sp. SYSU D00693]|uniref:galactose-1-phosphate uridylyltransferase n=1 Tax=Conexibacter sp. SYSU D00693 TaxID=2812560 RepID=UPI00196B704F|nr:DUF4921 family protein [Conexibacter sp. SYSU D00693]